MEENDVIRQVGDAADLLSSTGIAILNRSFPVGGRKEKYITEINRHPPVQISGSTAVKHMVNFYITKKKYMLFTNKEFILTIVIEGSENGLVYTVAVIGDRERAKILIEKLPEEMVSLKELNVLSLA